MEIESINGAQYFLTFIDDATQKTSGYFIKSKDEVTKVKILRSNNGKKYVNQMMQRILGVAGIKHQLTVEYTPERNGVAERANSTIVEKARTILQDA
ncbi:hypothetical protein PR048_014668 [Dryococelus australis]|uniref:Integrase catalytic domain-containing protein n=1 Tax=Dryococelus australis TaxID=614101 RepID=A0ABQ9HEV7_9NEOP|nr:hypothetical protein PR048_014668 [Dryococelus australis]